MVGPFAKIDPATLPCKASIHYTGQVAYAELPAHLAGFDVAIMPFARNEATAFISPTKTPEYLAGGKPVVSTLDRRRRGGVRRSGPLRRRACVFCRDVRSRVPPGSASVSAAESRFRRPPAGMRSSPECS